MRTSPRLLGGCAPLLVLTAVAGCSDPSAPGGATARARPIVFIAYVEQPGGAPGQSGIYRIGMDGRGLRRLTSESTPALYPALSPDGRRIAYAQDNRVWTMNADGSAQAPLLVDDVTCHGGYVRLSWAPDGTRLAAECSDGETYVLHVSGGTSYSLRARARVRIEYPDWSPDGSRLLFTAFDGSPFTSPDRSLYSMSPDGTGITRVARDAEEPAWSPDGRRIAFVAPTRNAAAQALFVMNADGTGQRPMTVPDSSFFDEGPAWSSDGAWIAFHRRGPSDCRRAAPPPLGRCSNHWDLHVVRPDGTGLRRLTPDSLQATRPDW